jgi:hypothetical protein
MTSQRRIEVKLVPGTGHGGFRTADAGRRTLRSARSVALAAVGVIGFLVWMVTVVVAAVAPDSLPHPVCACLRLRVDTLGVVAFALSGFAYVLYQRAARELDRVSALLRAVRLYGLAVAGHVALMGLSHPHTLDMQLTHLTPFISERTAGLIALLSAGMAHLLLRRPSR